MYGYRTGREPPPERWERGVGRRRVGPERTRSIAPVEVSGASPGGCNTGAAATFTVVRRGAPRRADDTTTPASDAPLAPRPPERPGSAVLSVRRVRTSGRRGRSGPMTPADTRDRRTHTGCICRALGMPRKDGAMGREVLWISSSMPWNCTLVAECSWGGPPWTRTLTSHSTAQMAPPVSTCTRSSRSTSRPCGTRAPGAAHQKGAASELDSRPWGARRWPSRR
jgi:hypothetical protein